MLVRLSGYTNAGDDRGQRLDASDFEEHHAFLELVHSCFSTAMSSTTSLRKSRRHHERPENPKPLKTLNPRALKPSIPPPAALLLYPPILPEDVRKSSQSDTIRKYFDVSTHVVPAAYPRLTPYVTFSELERKAGGFAGTETKESRSLRANQVAEQLMKLRDDSAKGKLPSDGSENRLLWNVVNRYSRRDTLDGSHLNRRRVTLLLAHANGFPREVRRVL